jgi:hypothetical protein
MARYTNAAIAAALSLWSINNASAWTSPSTSSIVNRRSSSILRALPVSNPYASLEASVLSSKSVEAMSSKASSAVSSVESAASSIFAPVQGALQQIIDSERALNNMEHTAVSNAARALLSTLDSFDVINAEMYSKIFSLPIETLQKIISTSIDAAKTYATNIDEGLLSDPSIGPILTTLQNKAMLLSPIIGSELASLPPTVGILASAGITYGIIATVLSIGEGPPPSSPYPLGRYDPSSARAFFDKRPLDVISRGVEIASISTKFALAVLKDKLDGKFEENQDVRALELAALLTKLGPTFSKLATVLVVVSSKLVWYFII